MKQNKFWDVPTSRKKKRPTPKTSHYCRICGRPLTDPISIERGVGQECWSKVQASKKNSKNLFDLGGEQYGIEKSHE